MVHSEDFERSLTAWLTGPGKSQENPGEVWFGFLDLACELGLPVKTGTLTIGAIHPKFSKVYYIWRRNKPWQMWLEVDETSELLEFNDLFATPENPKPLSYKNWENSPACPAVSVDILRSDLPRDNHVVRCIDTSEDGSYLARLIGEENTDFTVEQIQSIDHLLPVLSMAIELRSLQNRFEDILATYVGVRPASKILSGQIRRGEVTRIQAAIMLCDLRGFTARSLRLSSEQLVDRLNDYLDIVVPEIVNSGGEILKFIGDGVLAIFPTNDAEENDTAHCDRALHAGTAIQQALGNQRIMEESQVPLVVSIALHFGEVAYGNIGADGRQDFTVIGKDVNLVSRLEQLCKNMDENMLFSAEFNTRTSTHAEDLGEFLLKGYKNKHRVFRP